MSLRYKEALSAIEKKFFEDGDPGAVLAGRTNAVDAVVQEAFLAHLAPVRPSGMAALAVGGYGRSELFPHSDIDLILLVEGAAQPEPVRSALSVFLRTLWDAGLRLSHSVRTVDECLQYHAQNLELNISILDERFLTGDRALHDLLIRRLPKFYASERQTLMRHLIRQARDRQEKFHSTVYHLEPNIKESPGGLRDLHLIWWLSRLQDPARELPDWMAELAAAKYFLYQLRCYLHFTGGRDQNLLNFDAQEAIVDQPFVKQPYGGTSPEVAAWMREYFLAARRISRAAEQAVGVSEALVPSGLLGSFRDWRARLSTSEISVSRERLYLKTPTLLEADPELSLRLMRFIARHGVSLAADTERRIAQARTALEDYFADPRPVWNHLREIFLLPHALLALRAMQDTGLLSAVLPEWKLVEGLVIRDFYHRYTVDEHTLIVLENLLALGGNADPAKKRFAELFTEIESLPLLMFALLLHDIGKGCDGESHSIESAKLGETIMERIGMPEEDRPLVRFLVEQHLVLSSVMNSRDLDDPATARFVATRVGTAENLRYLALLTYADISGVNPTAMTPWRQGQLWRVYALGLRELTRELDSNRIGSAPADAFLEGLPSRYLRTHSREEIDEHLALAAEAQQNGVALSLARQSGVWKLSLVSVDRPGLFAALAGSLAGYGMDIVHAEAFANSQGEVLDSFVFSDPGRTLELNPPEVESLRQTVERAARGDLDVKAILNRKRRQPAAGGRGKIRPAVYFDSTASESSTLAEVVAEDRPGLLYDLSSTFAEAGCNIEVVLIDTEAHKALDVFYITRDGRKLTPDEESDMESRLKAVCAS